MVIQQNTWYERNTVVSVALKLLAVTTMLRLG